MLGPSWDIFGRSWAILGLCWSNLKQSWPILAQLAPSWGYLGTLFGPAWGYLVLLGAILSHRGTILNPKLAQKEPQDSPQMGQVGPRWAKIAPKLLQQSPNIAQDRPKMSQDGQDGPTEPFKEPLSALFKPASEVVGLLLCYYLRYSGSLQYFCFANRSSLGLHQTSLRTTCCYRFAWGNLQDT